MILIEILLPLYDNSGQPQGRDRFRVTEQELVDRFGGVTSFVRAPAQGKWQTDGGSTKRDEIVICEVMTEDLDRTWWKDYRERLAERFDQEELVVRASVFDRL